MKILHCFADHGVESETLLDYGDVIRVSINAEDTNDSQPIKADADSLPFTDDTEFDLGLLQPPCTKWSTMPDTKRDEAPNLIPTARRIGQEYCTDYIIENKPTAPLNDPVRLAGPTFNLPIKYERAFETSFKVEQPRQQERLSETSPYFYNNRTKEWWQSVKGCSGSYPREHIAKNSIPEAYLRYLLQQYAKSLNFDGDRNQYEDYDKKLSTRKGEYENQELTQF
jgi:hypothetical protein